MLNFYGGPNGKSFVIDWIFNTRTGTGNSMQNDISMGWKSPIAVGSYVVISYGEPNTEEYEDLLQRDLAADNKTYNSTLWQKVYDENKNANNGIDYKLIMSMAGFTPRIEFVKPIEVLNADEEPDITFDHSNIDKPKITLHLPQSQVITVPDAVVLDADEEPELTYDYGTTDGKGNITPGPQGGTINRPVLTFKLPQSQRIQQGVVNWIKANENPRFELDLSNINEPVLNFWLPVAQQIQQGDIEVIDADQDPRFEIDSTDPDNPVLKFWLPQSQVMDDPETTIVDPVEMPSVSLDDSDINHPKLEFELPRAVKFYYGDLLGENKDYEDETNDAFNDYGVGDYYINAKTGFIYQATKVEDTTCSFKYIATIQQPLPDVETTSISPYDGQNQSEPSVEKTLTDDGWQLEFKLPKAPMIDIDTEFLGSTETGSSTATITDDNTVTFNFKIPTGSKLFAGTAVSEESLTVTVEGARVGDLYLNAETGLVYILQTGGTWAEQDGSLKGPVGDALHVVRSYSTEEEDSFEAGKDLIIEKYVDDEGNPLPYKSDEIFAVTFIEEETGEEVSYWYFYTDDGQWSRVQLTGGVMNLIKNEYIDSPASNPVTNQTYSIDYLNKLIGGDINTNKNRTTLSKAQVIGLLSWGTWEDAKAGKIFTGN